MKDQKRFEYTGEFNKGQKCGQGRQVFPMGNIYEGSWSKNKQQGKGTHYASNGRKVFEGEWNLGEEVYGGVSS